MKYLIFLSLLILFSCVEKEEIKPDPEASARNSPLVTCGFYYRWWHTTTYPVTYSYGPGNLHRHWDVTIRPMFYTSSGVATSLPPNSWYTDIPQAVRLKWKLKNTSPTATYRMRTRKPGQGWSPKQTILAGNYSTEITVASANDGSCTVLLGDIFFEVELERVTCGSPLPGGQTTASHEFQVTSFTSDHQFGPAAGVTTIMMGGSSTENAGICAALTLP